MRIVLALAAPVAASFVGTSALDPPEAAARPGCRFVLGFGDARG